MIVPGFTVHYAPDVDEDIYVVKGAWYWWSGGVWFSSRHYNGPWVYVAPKRIPARHYGHGGPPGGILPGQALPRGGRGRGRRQ